MPPTTNAKRKLTLHPSLTRIERQGNGGCEAWIVFSIASAPLQAAADEGGLGAYNDLLDAAKTMEWTLAHFRERLHELDDGERVPTWLDDFRRAIRLNGY